VFDNIAENMLEIKIEQRVNIKFLAKLNKTPAHSAFSTQSFLTEKKKTTTLQHSSYSPDLAPRDFYLFPKIKCSLKGTHYQTVDDVKTKTAELLKGLAENDWQHCFQG